MNWLTRTYDREVGLQQDARLIDLATGVGVSYVAHGDPAGTPVVLLHAWVESLRSFDRLTPLLPPSLYTLAVDQRGHGDSDKPSHGYDLASLGADVVAFLDAVDLASAVLVGSSSGGYVKCGVTAWPGSALRHRRPTREQSPPPP